MPPPILNFPGHHCNWVDIADHFEYVGEGVCLDSSNNRFDRYRKDGVNNVEDCQQACLETTHCTSFTWRPNDELCQLESQNIVLDPTESTIGGTSWGNTEAGYGGTGEVAGHTDHSGFYCYKKLCNKNSQKF